jgi:DNA-binding NarL/FixJ family response regulator
LNGIEAARQLKRANPGAKLVLTMHPDLSFVSAAFDAGVSGYVLKQSAATGALVAAPAGCAGYESRTSRHDSTISVTHRFL